MSAVLSLVVALCACGQVDPEAELQAGIQSLEAGNYGEAAIRLNNVVQVQPGHGQARLLRGRLALRVGDAVGAADELGRAQALGVPAKELALELAEALTASGHADRALEVLAAVEPELGGEPDFRTVRAEALLLAGRPREAEQALAAAARGGGVRAAVARARVALAQNKTAEAEALLTETLSAAPGEPLALLARAELFARTERLADAAADLEGAAEAYRAAALGVREAEVLFRLVQVHLARNDLAAAEQIAVRLAARAPQASLTTFMRALVAYRGGRFEEAGTLLQPLVNAEAERVEFRSLLGATHLARGNLGQAEQQFLIVLASSPRDPAAIKLLAETRLRQRRPEAALATLRPLADRAADDAQIGMLSGMASLLAGDNEQALIYLEQAAALDPTNEWLRLQLARAYLAAGRDLNATELLGDVFERGGSETLEANLLRLFAALRAGAGDAGLTAANELLAEFPQNPHALSAAAIYFQLQGDTGRAREMFARAAAAETEGSTARMYFAAILAQEGRVDEAERLLRQLVADFNDDRAAMALAELLVARNAVEEAVALLQRAAEVAASPLPELALAHLYLRQADLAAATRYAEAAAEKAPSSGEVAATLGMVALADGRAAEAVELLRRAETSLPGRLGVSLALARAQLANGQPDSARATIHRVLEHAPQSPSLRRVLGEAELRLGNADEALAIATELQVEFPAQAGGYLLAADARIAERRYGAAADSLRLAYEREPTWEVVARLIGALQLGGRAEDAIRAAEQWAATHPEHLPGVLTLAGLRQNAGDDDNALRGYEAALRLDADNVIALNNAAWLSHESRPADALALAERAHELAGDNPAVLDTLGWILFRANREQDAVAYLQQAAELAPQSPEIRYHLAAALRALGRSAEARAVLTSLLQGEQSFEQREAAERLLESL